MNNMAMHINRLVTVRIVVLRIRLSPRRTRNYNTVSHLLSSSPQMSLLLPEDLSVIGHPFLVQK